APRTRHSFPTRRASDLIEAVADVIYKAALKAKTPSQFKKVTAKSLQAEIRDTGRPITPDIALFGRMVTSSAFRDIDSAVQCAHRSEEHTSELQSRENLV